MSPTPFVSIRKWIHWQGEEAGEDTDTLVLTSAAKYFIDIRIYLPKSPSNITQSDPNLPPTRLEWAFAGTAYSTPAEHDSETGQLKKPAHTQWTHWIDNKTTDEVMDEGDMFPKDDGSNEVLERGAMVNPNTGNMQKYEECWADLDSVLLPGEDQFQSWVLVTKTATPDTVVRGMMIRIGGYVQAILRNNKEVGLKKWKWSEDEKIWRETAVMGNLGSPLGTKDLGKAMKLGDEFVAHDGLMWRCVEAYAWK